MTGAALVALAVGGCGSMNSMGDTFKSDAGWFSKPITSVFKRDDGSGSMGATNFALSPSGPVPPEDLVNADGSCAPEAATPATATSTQPSERAVGSVAGDLAGQPMAQSANEGQPGLGGIALGMSECQAVRRAGTPSNVAITMADNNERKVVLTYLQGNWPGIYTFTSGRLKEVDAAPAPPKPARPAPKKKPAPRRS